LVFLAAEGIFIPGIANDGDEGIILMAQHKVILT